MALPKVGQPKAGTKYARRLTRRESEITGYTRTTVIEATKDGDIVFTKKNEPIVRGSKTATKKLLKFWA